MVLSSQIIYTKNKVSPRRGGEAPEVSERSEPLAWWAAQRPPGSSSGAGVVGGATPLVHRAELAWWAAQRPWFIERS